jgi:DNA-3-methyladenine glycosylase II
MNIHEMTLHPTPPFDFNKSLDFLEGFSPTRDEQSLAARVLTKAIMVAGQVVVFQVKSTGTVDAPRLECALHSAQPLDASAQAAARDRLSFFLSLDDDLRPFYAIALSDPAMAPEIQRLYGLHQVKFPTPFENAAWAVLSQRAPIPVARKMKQALVERFGASLAVDGEVYWAFPEAAAVAAAPVAELASLIHNERKAQYLNAVAVAFAQVDESFLRAGDYEEVLDWLRGIKGIGEWSADFILLRGLGRMQQLHFTPATIFERRMSRAVSRVYPSGPGRALTGQASISPSEIVRIAERYGDWQGYWALYLRTGESALGSTLMAFDAQAR